MGRPAAAAALAVLVVLPLLGLGGSAAAAFAPAATDPAVAFASAADDPAVAFASAADDPGAALASPADDIADGPPPADRTTDAAAATAQQTFARSTVEVTVHENGSGRWSFTYVRPLRNESQRENFAAYAERFNAQETDLYRSFVADAEAIVARGANATGREMGAESFDRRAWIRRSLGNDLGVVEMSFTWTGFARRSGGQVIVGDVFEGGLYLGPSQTLIFHPGPGLVFVQVLPEATQSNATSLPASDSVTWTGERQFTDNRPYLVFEPPGASAGTRTGDPLTGSPGVEETPEQSGGLPGGMVVFGVLLAVAVAVLGVGWTRGREGGLPALGGGPNPDEPGASGSTGDAPGASPGGDTTADTADAAGDDGSEPAPGEPTSATAGVADERLLSDEGRVVALLEASGGQLKQSEIVQETGWSKSKVSMLLSEMADEGRVEKLRLGRENVITLVEGAGDDSPPDGDDSPPDGDSGDDETTAADDGDPP